MKRLISITILLSLILPVRIYAGLITDFDPVEKQYLDKQRLEEDMSKEFKKQQQLEQEKPIKAVEHKPEEKSGSSWWKWALGILGGGGAAAAAGGGGGGSSPSSSGGTGSTTVTW